LQLEVEAADGDYVPRRVAAMSDVEQWLEDLGLGQYATAFAESLIDFAVLADLTDADLKELGIAALGDRKKLLKAIGGHVPFAAGVLGGWLGERRQAGA
jgi:hypothetical protein